MLISLILNSVLPASLSFIACFASCRMSSDKDKYSLHVAHDDSSDHGSSVSTDLQDEYEELLRYTIVNPNVESNASQPSQPKGEVAPDRFPTAAGSSPVSSPRKLSHSVLDFFSAHLLEDSSSPTSTSTHTDAHEVVVSDHLDESLRKVENILDRWSSGLKTNILSELSKWRLNFIDCHRMEMKKEKEKHAMIVKQLLKQIADLKELQRAFELSLGRKDEVLFSMLPLSETLSPCLSALAF